MKGIVFTEFLDMVEERYSAEIADEILQSAPLESGGAYTTVGTYPSGEMVALLVALSDRVGEPPAALLQAYGDRLFGRFAVLYPDLIDGYTDSLTFAASVEPIVHAEVRKLYPDAELPHFTTTWVDADTLEMEYRSPRQLGDLAAGLLHGLSQHFDDNVTITRQTINDGQAERFVLSRPAPSGS